MQGTLSVNRFPIRAFAAALVTASTLMLGILGGYLLRGITAPAVAASAAKPNVVVVQREAAPAWAAESDLTRALPGQAVSAPVERQLKRGFSD